MLTKPDPEGLYFFNDKYMLKLEPYLPISRIEK